MKKKRTILDNIKFSNLSLVIFCLFLSIMIINAFLIPMFLSMVNILLKLVDLYKLLEMPYLFFGSALFLFVTWYFFNALCNITYTLFKFAMTTSVYSSKKKGEKNDRTKK